MKYVRTFDNQAAALNKTTPLPSIVGLKTFDEIVLLGDDDVLGESAEIIEDGDFIAFNANAPIATDYIAVDLGLDSGTLWCNMNVGASSEIDYGLYFAWGETTGYEDDTDRVFDEDNYTAIDDTTLINKNLPAENDAATVNMGDEWHMPTSTQIEELLSGTTQELISDYNNSGEQVLKFTSNTNSNYIIFTLNGWYYEDGKSFTKSAIWSSTKKGTSYAYLLTHVGDSGALLNFPRYMGAGVRAVQG